MICEEWRKSKSKASQYFFIGKTIFFLLGVGGLIQLSMIFLLFYFEILLANMYISPSNMLA